MNSEFRTRFCEREKQVPAVGPCREEKGARRSSIPDSRRLRPVAISAPAGQHVRAFLRGGRFTLFFRQSILPQNSSPVKGRFRGSAGRGRARFHSAPFPLFLPDGELRGANQGLHPAPDCVIINPSIQYGFCTCGPNAVPARHDGGGARIVLRDFAVGTGDQRRRFPHVPKKREELP